MPKLQCVSTRELQPVMEPQDAWRRLPAAKRSVAARRELLVKDILSRIDHGISRNVAIDHLLARIESGQAETPILDAALALGRNGKPPQRATLHNWVSAFIDGGLVALASNNKGRVRKQYGWEIRARYFYDRPTKPAMHTVAYWLRQEGWESALDHRVRRYLKSLPATAGAESPARMGRHFYRQNLGPHVLRDESVLPVGFVYQGDGHNCDVYVAHPRTGKPWRPELTVWFDVRSHYCVGWYLSEAESALTTLYSLSHALTHHDHVPAMIHVDPGSGFKNRLMTDDVAGYLTRMSIEFMSALPGNAKGKGLVEGFFHIYEERYGKRWDTYCGHNRTDDYLRHLSKKVERGLITLPTFGQYLDGAREFIEGYNANVQKRLSCAPAELWQQLTRTSVEIGAEALIGPRERRMVRRWGVNLWNRLYRHSELANYNGREVLVEYNLHDDSHVAVRDLDGRFLCAAQLVDRKPWMPTSRIEDLEQRRLAGQRKRLQDKLDEAEARSRNTLEAQSECIDRLADFDAPALEHDDGQGDLDDIDFLSTDYLDQ